MSIGADRVNPRRHACLHSIVAELHPSDSQPYSQSRLNHGCRHRCPPQEKTHVGFTSKNLKYSWAPDKPHSKGTVLSFALPPNSPTPTPHPPGSSLTRVLCLPKQFARRDWRVAGWGMVGLSRAPKEGWGCRGGRWSLYSLCIEISRGFITSWEEHTGAQHVRRYFTATCAGSFLLVSCRGTTRYILACI